MSDDADGPPSEETAVQAARAAEESADRAEAAAETATDHPATMEEFLHETDEDVDLGAPGRPLNSRSPFVLGFFAAAGALLAWWVGGLILDIGSVLVLIVVSLFIAVGLNPLVEMLMRRGMRRSLSVTVVAFGVVAALALFLVAIVPIITDQVNTITTNAPGWLDQLQHARWIQDLDAKYDIIAKAQEAITAGHLASKVAGGALGVGLAVLSFLANTFVVVVLTLYFLATLPQLKRGMFQLAPASRRERVTLLGDRILRNIGGYVSGAFVVALCAGLSTLVFLFIVGLGQYAVALALVVALLDVIPMIGATLGAVIVCAIATATDLRTGIICVIFYVVYQQVENYLIYPRVMSKSVDIPGALTVIAALVGASLLGVVGALLAIPTAASLLLLVREVVIPRQDAR